MKMKFKLFSLVLLPVTYHVHIPDNNSALRTEEQRHLKRLIKYYRVRGQDGQRSASQIPRHVFGRQWPCFRGET